MSEKDEGQVRVDRIRSDRERRVARRTGQRSKAISQPLGQKGRTYDESSGSLCPPVCLAPAA